MHALQHWALLKVPSAAMHECVKMPHESLSRTKAVRVICMCIRVDFTSNITVISNCRIKAPF